jgi:hypothetical protein
VAAPCKRGLSLFGADLKLLIYMVLFFFWFRVQNARSQIFMVMTRAGGHG